METIFALLGAFAVVLVLVFIIGNVIGRSLPVGHVASRSAIESVPPRRLVRRIVGESDFGGTWTSLLEAAPGGGTRLVITENGEVYSAFFRFVARYIVGHHRTIDSFHAALRLRLDARGG